MQQMRCYSSVYLWNRAFNLSDSDWIHDLPSTGPNLTIMWQRLIRLKVEADNYCLVRKLWTLNRKTLIWSSNLCRFVERAGSHSGSCRNKTTCSQLAANKILHRSTSLHMLFSRLCLLSWRQICAKCTGLDSKNTWTWALRWLPVADDFLMVRMSLRNSQLTT